MKTFYGNQKQRAEVKRFVIASLDAIDIDAQGRTTYYIADHLWKLAPYHLVGVAYCEKWLGRSYYSVVTTVMQYNKERNLPTIGADDPEKLTAIFLYISAYKLLTESETFNTEYGETITQDRINRIRKEIRHVKEW